MYPILLVDDEIWALKGLEDILSWEDFGFQICGRCSSAEEAMQAMLEKHPAAVFTDIRMPGTSGIDMISWARAQNELDIEFVITSAYSDFDVAKKAIDYGAVGYVLKPLEITEVEAAARRLKKRLDEKKHPLVTVDLNDSASLAEVSHRLVDLFPAGQWCVAAVTSTTWQVPSHWQVVPIAVTGVSEQLFLYCYPEGDKAQNSPGVTFGRPHRSTYSCKDMLSEALTAYRGGFSYVPHPTVSAIQYYLGIHYDKKFYLKDLASHFFLTETYLCDLFKKNTGETVVNFLNRVRVNNACWLLQKTDLSIKEVAAHVGFPDYSYFGRIFRKSTGVTPDSYRSKPVD